MGVCLPDRDQAEKGRYRKYRYVRAFWQPHSRRAENGLLTVAFDVSTHHKLAARKIMAALYCWRVRSYTLIYNSFNRRSHQISTPQIKIFFFSFSCSLGGMCGAVVTSPFDVVKTRLQSDLFRTKHAGVGAVVGDSVVLVRKPGELLWHFVETAHIIRLASIPPPSLPPPLPEFIRTYALALRA